MLSKSLTNGLCLMSLFFSVALTVPVNEPMEHSRLSARAGTNDGSSRQNAKEATFDVTGWEDIAEENCYDMLCLRGGERSWQRNPTTNLRGTHYRQSGAKYKPFQKQNTHDRHTEQINPGPGKMETNSAEEFPWESMAQGGDGAHLFPASRPAQQAQSSSISKGFRGSDINLSHWFRITFTGNLGRFCRALQQNPPDTSICHNPESKLFGKSINLNDFVWYVVRTGGSLAYLHAAGSSKGKTSKRMTPIEVRALQAEGHKFIEARAEDFEDGLFSPLETRALDPEDDEFDPLEVRDAVFESDESAAFEARDENLEDNDDDSELTEEDLEILKP